VKKSLEWRYEFDSENDFKKWALDRLLYLDPKYHYVSTQTNSKGKRQHRGLADIFLRHESWEKGMQLAVEFKRPGNWHYSNDEQRIYHQRGDILIWDSWRMVCDCLGIEYIEQLEL
jgi:hypothetical protein